MSPKDPYQIPVDIEEIESEVQLPAETWIKQTEFDAINALSEEDFLEGKRYLNRLLFGETL